MTRMQIQAQRNAAAFHAAAARLIADGSDPAALVAGMIRAVLDLAKRHGSKFRTKTATLMRSSADELEREE
jgi:hypothetical protein